MKVYVASSWRNQFQQEVVRLLRAEGHEVYDFRGAGDGWGADMGEGGFAWSEVDPNWQSWPEDVPRYIRGLSHPRAIEGFNRDMDALRRCDACVLVNPCGQSAHAELGWACGAGKLTAVYCPAIREPDLMVSMADLVTDEWTKVADWLIQCMISQNEASKASRQTANRSGKIRSAENMAQKARRAKQPAP